MIAFALNGKTEKIGNVDVGSITKKVIGPRQNTNPSVQDHSKEALKNQEKKFICLLAAHDTLVEPVFVFSTNSTKVSPSVLTIHRGKLYNLHK